MKLTLLSDSSDNVEMEDLAWLSNAENFGEEPAEIVQQARPTRYPIDCFPQIVADAIYESLEYYHTPDSLTGSSVLANLSTVAQGLVDVARDRHLVGPVSLSLLTIAESGERKSTIDKHFSNGIRSYEKHMHQNYSEQFKEFLAQEAIWKAKHSGLTAKLKKNAGGKAESIKNLENDLVNLERNLIVKPRCPHIVLQDETIESLLYRLSNEWPSGALFNSEGGLFLGGHSMSTESVMRTLSKYNLLWDGAPIDVGRRGSDSFFFNGARLTVSLMTQDATLKNFLNKNADLARGIGYFSRMLPSWPTSTQGTRLYSPPRDLPANERLKSVITEILSIPLNIKQACLEHHVLGFNRQAHDVWCGYYNMVEKEVASGGVFDDVRDVASKNAENAARIAAIFHVVENKLNGEINVDAMKRAVKLANWHLHEAKRFFSEFSMSEDDKNLLELSKWLVIRCQKLKSLIIPIRDIQIYGPGKFRNRDTLEPILKKLESLNHIKLTQSKVSVNYLLIKKC